MTLKQIVKQYLEADGYNCLINREGGCVCRVYSDFMEYCGVSEVGYKNNLNCKPHNTEVA